MLTGTPIAAAETNRSAAPVATGRFAAIDFETADNGRDSACALGITIVDGTEIVRQAHFLIRPPRRQFLFTRIHGITWAHVANKPSFRELWPEMSALLQGVSFIAAHNAPFDRGVLHECCRVAEAEPPAVPFRCTVQLARKAWKLRSANLPAVCQHLGITLNHHRADSDALACARIVIAVREQRLPVAI